MNNSILQKNGTKTILFILGCLTGAVFFGITFGFRIVDPTYDGWILSSGGDAAQHYLGWKYFRRTPWTFPIGLTDGLSSDGLVSCMYSDSIPLLAVFFKILSPLLPETFQYTGLWQLMSFMLMGGLSSLLVSRFTKNYPLCIISSVFYIMAPTVLARALNHEALSGQWIIIAALLLWTYQGHGWKHKATPVILWSLLGMICVSVHIYFLPMIFLIMFGYVLTDIWKTRKLFHSVIICGCTGICSLLVLFIQGAFYGKGSFVAGGLGEFSSNYNVFFNAYGHSEFIKPLEAYNRNTEGFGYLGFGMIILGALAVIAAPLSCIKKDSSFKETVRERLSRYGIITAIVLLVVFISMFVAASPKGTFNDKIIYEINYPYIITGALMVFRASGRFIWVADYILFTAFIAVFAKLDKKIIAASAVAVCAGFQIYDIHGWIRSLNSFYSADEYIYDSPLKSSEWDQITKDRDTFVFLPLTPDYLAYYSSYEAFAEYGCDKDMELTSFYLARANYQNLAEYAQDCLDDLKDGNGMKNAVYIFFEPEAAEELDETDAEIMEIDGYTVALSR